VCCSVLQCVAVCCSVLHSVAVSLDSKGACLQWAQVCSVLQCVAVCSSGSGLKRACLHWARCAVCCSVLQSVAECCRV